MILNFRTVDVELVYDSWTKQHWFIHEGNDGSYYYLKNDDGKHDLLTLKGGTIKVKGGHFEPFKTQDAIQARLGAQFSDGLAVFFAAAISAPFVWAAIAEGGAALWAAVETQALNAIARAVLTYWKYAPAIGSAGMKMAEFLDESGSVGASNASRFAKLTLEEQLTVRILVGSGRNVKILERSAAKTADFLIDGIKTELKTLDAEKFNMNTAVTKITEAFKQGKNVILNALKYDLDESQVKQVIERAKGSMGGSLPGNVEIWTQKGQYKF